MVMTPEQPPQESSDDLLDRIAKRALEENLKIPNLEKKLNEKRAEEALEHIEADLIPDVEVETAYQPDELTAPLDQLDILDAYRQWCGKSNPDPGTKRESIMISCPMPDHPDKTPSAWVNLDKQVWYCGACERGGDKYDIAAIHFGMGLDTYKKSSFPELRRLMGADLGYHVATIAGREYFLPEDTVTPEDKNEETPAPTITVKYMPAAMGHNQKEFAPAVEIPWRDIVPANTFLYEFIDACSVTDLPEEYFFWLGLMAVGFAAANNVTLHDDPPIQANLFVTLLGASGIGKTRSIYFLNELLRDVFPYDEDDPANRGVLFSASPGSAEALIDTFIRYEYDGSEPDKIVGRLPVRGLVTFPEFSLLVSKASRTGSALKPVLIELYDAAGPVGTRSRGAGTTRVEHGDYFCQILSTTQPQVIRELLNRSDAHSGFANRWIFATGVRKPLHAWGGGRPVDLRSATLSARTLKTWANKTRLVAPSEPAKKTWSEFFRAYLEPIRVEENKLTLLTRSDLMLKKLILLFAVNEQTEIVNPELIERVFKVWPNIAATSGYLIEEIKRSSAEQPPGSGDFAEELLGAIERHSESVGRPPSRRDILRLLPERYQRHPNEIAKSLKVLLELGMIEEIISPAGKRGRPTIRYRITAE